MYWTWVFKWKVMLTTFEIKKAETKKRKTKNYFWVWPIFQRRFVSGAFKTLFQELKEDREQFFRYLRTSPEQFNDLLFLVEGSIVKCATQIRIPISPQEHLASINIKFFNIWWIIFRIDKATISKIITETCNAIYVHVKHERPLGLQLY